MSASCSDPHRKQSSGALREIVKRLLVRICSDSEQQHEREQRDERIWMPHPTSERVNLKREAWRELLVRHILYRKYDHSQSFPRLERNTPAREGPEKRQSRSSASFEISGGAFSDLRKGHQRSFEDPKTHQVAQWRWRFFGSRGKKTTGGSVPNAFDEAPQVL